MAWPLVCRRLERLPNATQLFEEPCLQFPGRFGSKQYRTLLRRANQWRQDARAPGVEIGPKTLRRSGDNHAAAVQLPLEEHWEEMAQCLESNPDQTALEILVEIQARH